MKVYKVSPSSIICSSVTTGSGFNSGMNDYIGGFDPDTGGFGVIDGEID